MRNCLYMICPSDYLESVIHSRFEGHKYFYTSLGNTLALNNNTLGQIAVLIEANNIKEIALVLSENNSIILDALSIRKNIRIKGLSDTYKQLNEYEKQTLKTWELRDQQIMILSYHLNNKIKELRSGLHFFLPKVPEIKGKLFFKSSSSFKEIHSELVCTDSLILN